MMDRIVRGRFYQVEPIEAGAEAFGACLTALWAKADRAVYQDLGYGAFVQIERYAEDRQDPDFVAGEFVRQQTDNIPPVAAAGAPLVGNSNPLGHRSAFRFHIPTNILLVEVRQAAVTVARINGLLKACARGHRGFLFSPCLTENAIQRLRDGTPKRVSMRVARPSALKGESASMSLEDNLAGLQEFFGGPSIEITSGFPRGNRDGTLNVKNLLRAVGWGAERREHVEKIEVKIQEEPNPIDLFSEQMKIESTLDLDSLNVAKNYDVRDAFLSAGFRVRMPEILRMYGV
ncbi:hypothetical protein E4L95_02710 [Paracoccus liaowanqingii]|uniref:DUF4747 family protein n=1 Tax=Paracoccus liaowanqingii TaxID=2560053 RepID=A0A4Z1CRU7_9RHOB|nr:hypothetical protein [Paracoccus liaowanqingii]TGN68049.1 hypothetical protein E4L95_02710 [Paracoccus liaowanqingii]